MMLPGDELMPEWLKFTLATAFGAGGVKFLSVWLENRRLGKKEFRETLLERVRELEQVVSRLQTRMGNLRVEAAHIETENKQLKRRLKELEDANKNPDGAEDGEST